MKDAHIIESDEDRPKLCRFNFYPHISGKFF